MVSADPTPLVPLVDAFEGTLRGSLELARGLSGEQWDLPTDCPAWTVRDQISHLIGVERYLLGDPRPVHELADMPYLRDDFARFTELDVDARRAHQPAELVAELAETLDRRMALLRAPDLTPDTPLPSPFGMRPAGWVLRLRCFDCWVHEQDLRQAVGQPGGLDTPAAGVAVGWVRRALPRVLATEVSAPTGTRLRLTVVGPHGFDTVLGVGDDGRGVDLGPSDQSGAGAARAARTMGAALTMGTEAFMRRAAGRWPVARTPATVDGTDKGSQLAARFLEAMAITP